jgi:hypothetical protein
MDISRLPVTPWAPTASNTHNRSVRAAPGQGVESAGAPRRGARAGDAVERVVQGELLQRERTFYQSTRAYLNERSFENALPSDLRAGAARPSRSAIFHYLNNTRAEAIADLTQGQSVNCFV